jgi:Rha family phage regulatory protein
MNELVYLKSDEAVCDSLQVAEKFGKRHDTVVRAISNLRKNVEIEQRKMFRNSQYKDSQGRTYPKYEMNRKGFTILVMGFNGKDAVHWKLLYSDAFEKMENLIKEKSTETWVETRKSGKLTRKAETDTIQKLVGYAKEQGSAHADMLYMTYSKLANKMAGIQKRDEATVTQLNNLSLMENVILHIIDNGIMQQKHYKDIYKDCKKRLETVKDLACLEQVG